MKLVVCAMAMAHAACAVNLPENYLRGVVDGREPDVTEKIRFEEARHTAAPAALPTTEAAPKAGAAPPRTESAGVQSAPGAVTQEFCLQVLQDVKAKAAPYYTQGPSGTPQWTNECREDLVQQCGSTVCGWAVQYKAALADNCNSSCPTGCPGTGAFASSLLQPANQGLLYAVITAESAVLSVQKKTPGSAEAARTAGEAKQDSPDLKKTTALRFRARRSDGTAGVAGQPIVGSTVVQQQSATQLQAPTMTPGAGSVGIVDPAEMSPPGPEPVVTQAFCQDMLRKVEAKEAPYYIEGKFTGEAREGLLNQCGKRWCGWALKYKNMAETCPQCPTNCNQWDGPFVKKIMADPAFNPMVQNLYSVLVQPPATGPAANDPRDPDYKAAKKSTLIPQLMPTGMYQPPGGPLPEIGAGPAGAGASGVPFPQATGGAGGYMLSRNGSANGGAAPTVTPAFCKDVLNKVKNKEAPYYVQGQYTPECRTALTQQCGQQMCQWSQIYGQLIQSCGQNCPTDCNQPSVYMQQLMQQQNFQPFVSDVYNMVVVRLPPQPTQTGPPPQVISPASAPNIRGPPSPNDPRDPAYQANKGAVRVTGVDPNAATAPAPPVAPGAAAAAAPR